MSRLSIIRECLTITGNNLYGSVDDGSPEWVSGTAAYDTAVEWALDEHDWGFGKRIDEVEADVDADDEFEAPDDPAYTYRHSRPTEALHIIRVMSEGGQTLTDYRIVGNKIYAHEDTVLVEYVEEPDPDDWPGLFVRVVRHQTMAGIYRSLNKDTKAADAEERKAEAYLSKARPRADLQEPGKTRFVSSLASARRTRRG